MAVVGTPAYMAPEQLTADGPLDERVDVYAAGALLFEMLTGARAWPGDDAFQVAVARLHRPPPDPRSVTPDLAPELATVVLRALSQSPAERFPSARSFAVAAAAAVGRLEAGPVRPQPAIPVRGARSIAVLPFRAAPEDLWIADGVSEELIDTLSMTRGLLVRPFGAVAAQRGWDPIEAGRALGVEVVVDGSVRRLRWRSLGDPARRRTGGPGSRGGPDCGSRRWCRGSPRSRRCGHFRSASGWCPSPRRSARWARYPERRRVACRASRCGWRPCRPRQPVPRRRWSGRGMPRGKMPSPGRDRRRRGGGGGAPGK